MIQILRYLQLSNVNVSRLYRRKNYFFRDLQLLIFLSYELQFKTILIIIFATLQGKEFTINTQNPDMKRYWSLPNEPLLQETFPKWDFLLLYIWRSELVIGCFTGAHFPLGGCHPTKQDNFCIDPIHVRSAIFVCPFHNSVSQPLIWLSTTVFIAENTCLSFTCTICFLFFSCHFLGKGNLLSWS